MAFLPTPSAALRYWNMAQQRYCCRLRDIEIPCASLPTRSPSQPRTPARNAGVLDLSKTTAGERQTVCWREMDSNHRSPVRRGAVLSLPPSPAEAVVVVAEVMVPAEIAAQIARLRSPTADGALPSLRWKVE